MDNNNTSDPENEAQDGPEDPPKPEENTLTHPKFQDLREALQILYIRGNQSGRIYFNKEWPDLASYVLGQELIETDTHGSGDAELRKGLEEAAEQRQYALIETCESLEENSAKSGVLQIDYVEETIGSLGRDLSLLIYTSKIVDRFAPESAEPEAPKAPETPAVSEEAPSSTAPADAPPATAETETAPEDTPRAPRSVSGVIEIEKAS